MIKAVILAGGTGSELLPLTISTPKPLLPIGNFPLLLFQIQQLKKAGITEIILSLSYQPRKLRDIFEDGSNFGVMLRYHVESTPLGTAGAFKVAEHLLDDTTLVLNGDILTEFAFRRALDVHKETQAIATIGVCKVDNPRAYGVVELDSSGRVRRFMERPRGEEVRTNTINAGIYVLEPEVLEWIPQGRPFYFERDLFTVLLEKQAPFFATEFNEYWTEITRPDNYLQSNMDFLDGKISVPEFAAFPKKHHPPQNPLAIADSACFIDEQCVIKPGAQIEHSVIGSNCRIEEEAHIRNSVLWPGCRIQRDSAISGSILGRGCLVGDGVRVRPGNLIGDKSTLSSYSKT